jgi:hypothetical protein
VGELQWRDVEAAADLGHPAARLVVPSAYRINCDPIHNSTENFIRTLVDYVWSSGRVGVSKVLVGAFSLVEDQIPEGLSHLREVLTSIRAWVNCPCKSCKERVKQCVSTLELERRRVNRETLDLVEALSGCIRTVTRDRGVKQRKQLARSTLLHIHRSLNPFSSTKASQAARQRILEAAQAALVR